MPIGLVLGTGLLTTVSVIVSMDSFGPVTDNAQRSVDMSGDLEGDAAAALTHLHTVGNTTKGIAKGSATATAVLVATAPSGLSAAQPNILVGVIIGEMAALLFASLLIMTVGRVLQRVIIEARNQVRNYSGINGYTEKPGYAREVDICAADSLRELVTPGLLAVPATIAVGSGSGTPRSAPAGPTCSGRSADGGVPDQLSQSGLAGVSASSAMVNEP
jgi:K(+)-stimulated pyrophosphate-energized sodium pump